MAQRGRRAEVSRLNKRNKQRNTKQQNKPKQTETNDSKKLFCLLHGNSSLTCAVVLLVGVMRSLQCVVFALRRSFWLLFLLFYRFFFFVRSSEDGRKLLEALGRSLVGARNFVRASEVLAQLAASSPSASPSLELMRARALLWSGQFGPSLKLVRRLCLRNARENPETANENILLNGALMISLSHSFASDVSFLFVSRS